MALSELFILIQWDMKINHGWSWDRMRARLMLLDLRWEQFIHRNLGKGPFVFLWYLTRLFGSLFQWFLCNSNIPGTTIIGRGLRLPHPQNIIIAGFSEIGEFCTIYHNVSIAWNGFLPVKPSAPKIGDQVLIGAGSIIVGDIEIGSDVLIGAGTVVTHSIVDHSRVVCAPAVVASRHPGDQAALPGSDRHIQDPYSIWR
jgi:serine O-acetyltransferase